MFEEKKNAEQPAQKKTYLSPELKEWGSIAEITQGEGGKWRDVDAVWDALSTEAVPA